MKLSHILFTAALCVSAFSASPGQEVRDWTDKGSGRKIAASMISADPAKRTVTIETKEGQSFTLSVDRLVEADLLYIREQLTKPAPTPAPAPAPGAPPPATPPAAAPAAAPAGAPAPPPPQIAVVPAKKYKFPTGTQILGAVKRERPRVFLNAAGLASLKARLATDPVSAALAKNVEKTGEVWLSKYPLQQKRGEGGGVGAEGLHRFLSFGLMDFISGDPKWKDRMPSELEALAEFTNWKPDEGHDCSEFVFAVALGYDWFRSTLNDEKARKVRTALIQLGMDALKAHLEHEPMPITTKRPEPGQKLEPSNAPAPKKPEEKLPKTSEEMVMASALLVAAISILDEESAVAAQAANAAAKVLGEGLTQFAPDGIWTEGLSRGEQVLDALAILSMTLRSATGSDYGITTVEGLPQTQWARLLLNGPAGVFNYSSFEGNGFTKPWISTWLKMNHGNLGVSSFTVGAAASDQSGGLNQAGQLVFMSPYTTGSATPANFDYVIASAQVGAMRSAWHDNKALFLGFKGGDNELPGSQLDLGTFVLDAGGQRWAAELGTFSAQGRPLNLRDTKRFERYRDNTLGQNVLRFAGLPEEADKKDDKKKAPGSPDLPHNQSVTAKAPIVAFSSTPELGVAVVDLSDAYSNRVRSYKRGYMLNRGPSPYAMIQDELEIKGTASPEWIMHTKAEVTASGKKATLKLGNNIMTATLLSPADASFSTEIVPEPANTQSEGSFKGVSVLKVALKDLKGKHTISVAFAQGDAGVEVNVAPTEAWLPKKR